MEDVTPQTINLLTRTGLSATVLDKIEDPLETPPSCSPHTPP